MLDKSVYIVGGDNLIARMFKGRNWKVVDHPNEASFLMFTGGADVSPELYGERNTHSSCNPKRDLQEIYFYNQYPAHAKLGICRGAQFLNVMLGGKMLQHIPDDSHCRGNHMAIFQYDQQGVRKLEEVEVTSTHHQGIIRPDYSSLSGWSTHGFTWSNARTVAQNPNYFVSDGKDSTPIAIEAFRETRDEFKADTLGFQPHPEYGHKPTENIFFTLIMSQFGV